MLHLLKSVGDLKVSEYRTVLLASIVLSLLIGGCSFDGANRTPGHSRYANYGGYPANYRELIKDYFEIRLLEPDSARYRFEAPIKAYTRKSQAIGGTVDTYGYLVTTWVNVKNNSGGYAGEKPHRLLIRNRRVLVEVLPNPEFPEPWYQ